MRVTGCQRIRLWTVLIAGTLTTGSQLAAQVLPATPPPRDTVPGLNDDGTPGSDKLIAPDTGMGPTAKPGPVPPRPPEPPSFFPMSTYAEQPHPGDPLDPSVGQPHYDAPFWHYGHWFRPKAATLTALQRCACPDPFRPRGFGNLFARPCSPYRMEYDPYVIMDERNQYGPSYFVRPPDQRCWDHKPRRR